MGSSWRRRRRTGGTSGRPACTRSTWNATLSNRLLFEAAAGTCDFDWPDKFQPETGNAISVLDQDANFAYGSADCGIVPAFEPPAREALLGTPQRGSMTYVTGSHNFKTGFHLMQGITETTAFVNQNRSYRFRGRPRGPRCPTCVTLYANPFTREEEMNANLGMFAQDRWTVKRLTLNLGLRFEYVNAEMVAHDLPAGEFTPGASLRRDQERAELDGCESPARRRLRSVWRRTNGDQSVVWPLCASIRPRSLRMPSIRFSPTPPLISPGTTRRFGRGRSADGSISFLIAICPIRPNNAECGAYDNLNFGTPNVRARYADDVITGFGNRGYLWDLATEVQQQDWAADVGDR